MFKYITYDLTNVKESRSLRCFLYLNITFENESEGGAGGGKRT